MCESREMMGFDGALKWYVESIMALCVFVCEMIMALCVCMRGVCSTSVPFSAHFIFISDFCFTFCPF